MHTRLDTSLRSLTVLLLVAVFGVSIAEAQPPRRGNGPPDARTQDYRLFRIDTSKLNCGCKSRVEVQVQNIYKNRGSRVPVELKVWQAGVPSNTYRQLWNPRSGVELEKLVFDQVEVPCGVTNHLKATIDFDDRSDNNDKQVQVQVTQFLSAAQWHRPAASAYRLRLGDHVARLRQGSGPSLRRCRRLP